MKYSDLTIIQKIGLKGEFDKNPKMAAYKAIWILWNFKIAIEYFLNNDINDLIYNLTKRN